MLRLDQELNVLEVIENLQQNFIDNCFYVGSFCQALFVTGLVQDIHP
jgi:hypothetical protein